MALEILFSEVLHLLEVCIRTDEFKVLTLREDTAASNLQNLLERNATVHSSPSIRYC